MPTSSVALDSAAATSAAPTSLVTTPTRDLRRCASCGATRVTSITMTLTDGSPVDFTSCHRCERKSWVQHGRELDIDTVLVKAKKHKAT